MKANFMRLHTPAFLIILTLGLRAAASALTLSETNGTAITGSIYSYTPGSGVVKIRQTNDSILRPYSAFSAESQQQIMRWRADKNFDRRSNLEASFVPRSSVSSSNITGTVTESILNTKREATIGTEERTFRSYEITLKNNSDTPFENLTVDYRIFYTQPLTEDYTGKYQLAGSADCERLDPDAVWEFKSPSFLSSIVYRAAPLIRWTGMPMSTHATIDGILLRIRKPGMSDEWVEREIEYKDVPRRRDRADYQKVYK